MFHLIVVKTCGADCGYFVAVREVQFGIEMIPVILPPSRSPQSGSFVIWTWPGLTKY